MTPHLATALFDDMWAGWVPCHVEPFKTTWQGKRTTRYRWTRDDGQSVGVWRNNSFATVDAAVRAAEHVRRFMEIG